MAVYLANAFSPSMIPLSPGEAAQLCLRRLTVEEARRLLAQGFECAIGHASTAQLAAELLGVDTSGCQRRMIALQPGDTAVILTLTFRPPEGRIYSYEELRELLGQGRIGLWAVHRGPC